MAQTATLLAASFDDVDRNSYTTSSITATNGRLIVAFITVRRGAGVSTPTFSTAGPVASWTQVGFGVTTGSVSAVFAFVGIGNGGTGTPVVDLGGVSHVCCHWSFVELTNVDVSAGAVAAVAQTKASALLATNTSLTVTFDNAFQSASDGVLAAMTMQQNENITAGSGFTELSDTGGTTPAQRQQVEFLASNDSTVDWSWTTTITNAAGVALELVYTKVQATFAAPLGGLTGAATAVVQHEATLAAPLGSLTAAITATVQHEAVLAAPLGSLTAVAVATPQVEATLTAPLGALAAAATATVEHPATFTAPLGGLTATFTADLTHEAVLAAPLGGLTAAATATVTHEAVLTAALGGLSATAIAAPPLRFSKVVYGNRRIDVNPVTAARNPLGNRLMRHYGSQPRGVNVYLLNDGTVTEADPSDWSTVRRVLWGGHQETIEPDEQAVLVSAGYAEFIQ